MSRSLGPFLDYRRSRPLVAVAVASSLMAAPLSALAHAPRTYGGPMAVLQETKKSPAEAAASAPDTTEPVAAEPPPPEGPAVEPFDPTRDTPEGMEARRLSRAGIGLSIVGALIGTGATLLYVADPCDPMPGNDCHEDARRRASLIVGIPGAVALATGMTLLTIGQLRLRRLRATMAADRDGFAVSVTTRF